MQNTKAPFRHGERIKSLEERKEAIINCISKLSDNLKLERILQKHLQDFLFSHKLSPLAYSYNLSDQEGL